MRATAYPDGIAVPLTIIGDESRDEAVPGGYGRASFTALLATNDRERILGAPVFIYAAAGPPWAGKVSRVAQVKHGVCKVECDGWQEAFGRKIRDVAYCDTNFLGDLVDFNGQNWGIFSRSNSGGVLKIVQNPGTTSGTSDGGGYIYHGDAPLVKLVLTAQSNSATFALMVQGTDVNGTFHGSPTTWTAGTYAAQTVTFPAGTYGFYIWGSTGAANTATASEFWVGAYDLKLYGSSLASVTVSNVIGDICDQLATTDLPAGAAYRRYIEAETTVIEPLVFDEDSTEADKVDTLLDYSTYEFGIFSRKVAGVWTPVPVLRDPGTTADYVCVVGKGATADVSDLDMEPLASKVRVMYQDTDGRTRYTDRTDTDATHYLVKRGIEKWAKVRAETTSATLAATIGDNYLALAGMAQVSGDITITTAIRDASGGKVLPCEIEAGRRILVLGLDCGAVTGRIVSVKKKGSYRAVVTINNKPRTLDVFLARLKKREAA